MRTQAPPTFNDRVLGLSCFACGAKHDHRKRQNVCQSCGMPLRVDYRLDRSTMSPRGATDGPSSLWRYRDVLPVATGEVTLAEGWTPLIRADDRVWIKDEARNPTGSFKARGMTVAVSGAVATGASALAVPSTGNAGCALAAYGAAANVPVTVAIPEGTPNAFIAQCRLYGAQVALVPGTIGDAGTWLREHGPKEAFVVSTLGEPYRVEGKKTMAYELYEQFDGSLPDVIVYPTGGGTGMVGMWKAFGEMRALGWLAADARFPRLVCVQAAGCAPIVHAFETGAERTTPWQNPARGASGLLVPAPIGGFLVLRALRETRGTAIAVDEAALAAGTTAAATQTGIDMCFEGGAAWAALTILRARGWIRSDERVVVFNTGTGLKSR